MRTGDVGELGKAAVIRGCVFTFPSALICTPFATDGLSFPSVSKADVPGCPEYVGLVSPIPDLVIVRLLVAAGLLGVIPFSMSPAFKPVCGVSDNLMLFTDAVAE